jgi:phosphoribosyl-ATP pyrophosphohydrolase
LPARQACLSHTLYFRGQDEMLWQALEKPTMPFTLHDLEQRVKERAAASAEASYTRKLLDRGVAHCAKKLGEEAIETALAAVGEDRDRLIAEAADLVYHLVVVLQARGVALAEVEAALAARTGQSGLQEKASRKQV